MKLENFAGKIDVIKIEVLPNKKSTYPSINVVFRIENKSTNSVIGLPAICRFKWEEFDIGESIAFISPPGYPTHISAGDSGSLQSSLLSKRASYYSVFQFRPEVFGFIMKTLEGRSPGRRKVVLDIEACFPFITQDRSSPPKEPPHSLNLWLTHHYVIEESTWYDWVKSWGVNISWMYLPTDLANELKERKEKSGLSSEWEVISEMLKQSTGLKPSYLLLLKNAEEKIEEMINTATKQILIMCRAIDTTVSPKIIDSFKKGVEVKILLPPLDRLRRQKIPDLRRVEKAFDQFKEEGIEVRENPDVHARFLIVDNKAIVGSTDLDAYGLTVHFNASILTTDPLIVDRIKMFFNEVWDKSKA